MGYDKITFGNRITGFVDRRKSVAIPVVRASGPLGFSAYIYQCWLNVDYDGAHRAYGLNRPDEGAKKFPHQKGLNPVEPGLLNARFEGKGYWSSIYVATREEALVLLRKYYSGFMAFKPDKQQDILNQFLDTRTSTIVGSLENTPGDKKFPIVQLPEMGQPAPGYYVSFSNAHTDETNKNRWDQNRYIDAVEVPYSVVPRLPGVRMGDYGLIIRNKTGASTPFIFGDSANKFGSTTLGECSAFIYRNIGEGKYNDENYSFIVFPGSGSGAATSKAVDKMMGVVRSHFQKISGADDALAMRLAASDPDYTNINKAIWEWGGPNYNVAHHRSHGGPETRDEDFPDN